MTIFINTPCERCKNFTGLKDGWKMACNAFPDGIPAEFDRQNPDPTILAECANGYKYEYDESKDIFKILEKERKLREQGKPE